MTTAGAGNSTCFHSGAIAKLEVRVDMLESSMNTVQSSMQRLEDNSDEILRAVKFGKGIVGFARKHGGALLAFAIGAGFMNENLAALIRSLLGI